MRETEIMSMTIDLCGLVERVLKKSQLGAERRGFPNALYAGVLI